MPAIHAQREHCAECVSVSVCVYVERHVGRVVLCFYAWWAASRKHFICTIKGSNLEMGQPPLRASARLMDICMYISLSTLSEEVCVCLCVSAKHVPRLFMWKRDKCALHPLSHSLCSHCTVYERASDGILPYFTAGAVGVFQKRLCLPSPFSLRDNVIVFESVPAKCVRCLYA